MAYALLVGIVLLLGFLLFFTGSKYHKKFFANKLSNQRNFMSIVRITFPIIGGTDVIIGFSQMGKLAGEFKAFTIFFGVPVGIIVLLFGIFTPKLYGNQ